MRIVTAGNLHYPRIRFHRASFQTLGESTGCAKGSEDAQRTPRDESSGVRASLTRHGRSTSASRQRQLASASLRLRLSPATGGTPLATRREPVEQGARARESPRRARRGRDSGVVDRAVSGGVYRSSSEWLGSNRFDSPQSARAM